MAVILLMVVFAGLICGCTPKQEQIPETTSAVQETVDADAETSVSAENTAQMQTIETVYIPLQVSEKFMQDLIHREVMEGSVAMESFSMKSGDAVLELFQISFNNPHASNIMGNLKIGEDMIPVSVSVVEYAEEIFQNDDEVNRYYFMMDALTDILASIREHESFNDKNTTNLEMRDTTASYWTFSLPAGMYLEETKANDDYTVDFYGMIGEQKFRLYTVAVSESTLNTVLGLYTTEVFTKPISIESYDLPDTSDWKQEDIAQLYTMMDTINDTIGVIVSSEQFEQIQAEE